MIGSIAEVYKYIHANHSYSVDHAVKNEGYDIVSLAGTTPVFKC